MKTSAAVVLVLLMSVSSALAQDAQGLNDRWMASFNKGDAAGVAALYTEDATLLPEGSPTVQGRAGIEAFWKGAGDAVQDIVLKSEKVTALGPDAASDIGTWSLKTKGANPQSSEGKYLLILRKVGADWKITTDIWNEDK